MLRQRLDPSLTDNSARPVCLAGTRREILREINEWVFSDTNQSIFWLYGVAGSGKSTISMSVAECLRDLSRLGGLLVFERGKGEVGSVIRTIAYKLALFGCTIGSRIVAELDGEKDVTMASLRYQFDRLLLRPLGSLTDSLLGPIVIVLDALDECGTPESRESLMQLVQREIPVRVR